MALTLFILTNRHQWELDVITYMLTTSFVDVVSSYKPRSNVLCRVKFYILLILMMFLPICSNAEPWLHVEMNDEQSVDLKVLDGMSLSIDNDKILVSGHDVELEIAHVKKFSYIDKVTNFFEEDTTIKLERKLIIGVHSILGYQVDDGSNLSNLPPGVYVLRYSNGTNIKMLLR